jgi:hypothetical protein
LYAKAPKGDWRDTAGRRGQSSITGQLHRLRYVGGEQLLDSVMVGANAFFDFIVFSGEPFARQRYKLIYVGRC